MAPKIVDKETRKLQLASCALDVFARVGFDKASISLIASECGVGKGTVYEYFDSKEDLFLEAVMVWLAGVESDTRQQLEGRLDPQAPPLSQLKSYLSATAESFLKNPYYKRMSLIMTNLMISHTQWLMQSDMLKHSTESFRGVIRDLIQSAVESGELPETAIKHSELHAKNLIAGLDGIELHASITEDYIDPKEQYDLYIETYLRGIG